VGAPHERRAPRAVTLGVVHEDGVGDLFHEP
jgi:hypothetical protein